MYVKTGYRLWYYIMRWIWGWASLLDGIITVVTFGFWRPDIRFIVTGEILMFLVNTPVEVWE